MRVSMPRLEEIRERVVDAVEREEEVLGMPPVLLLAILDDLRDLYERLDGASPRTFASTVEN